VARADRPYDPPSSPNRGLVQASAVLTALGLLALWAVFVLWASSKSPVVLPCLTVPGMLLGAAAFLAFPSWSRR
jgi:hypothetical protein